MKFYVKEKTNVDNIRSSEKESGDGGPKWKRREWLT